MRTTSRSGGAWATRFAADHRGLAALALVDPPLGAIAATLPTVLVPVLGTVAARDADSEGDLEEARSAVAHAEWVRYGGVAAGYWDADREEYDDAAATDTWDRVIGFLGRRLPPKE